MNVMNRFALRSMKANRKWTVVTLIGIIISTAMLSAVSSFCASIIELLRNEAIAGNGNWHAIISGVRMKDVSVFEEAGFLSEVALSREAGYAPLANSKNPGKPFLYIQQFTENSYLNFPVELIEGRMPQNDRELIVSRHTETNGGVKLEVGDTLSLDVGKRIYEGASLGQGVSYGFYSIYEDEETIHSETFSAEQTITYEVVGIIERPAFEPSHAPGYTAFTYLNVEALKPDDTVTVTLLAKTLRHSFFDDIRALAESVTTDHTIVSFNNELLRYSGVVANDNVQNVIYGFAAVFIVIIIIASVSLIYNAFAISISERVSQLGMLASVGATKRQKRRSIYFEGFVLGIIGIPIGVLGGIAGIGVTLWLIRPLMQDFINLASSPGLVLHISLVSVVTAIALAALTIFISVWIPALRASKIMPIDAIRQSKEIRLTRKKVKTSRLTHLLFGFEGELALKNLKRSRKKYRATVLSLIISLVLFLTVSYYVEVMSKTSNAVERGYNFDFEISYTDFPDDQVSDAYNKMASMDHVTGIAMAKTAMGIIKTDNTQISELARQIYPSGGEVESINMNISLYCYDDDTFDSYVSALGADPAEYHDPDNPKVIIINYGQGYLNGKKAAGEILTVNPNDKLSYYSPHASDGTESDMELEVGMLTDQRPMGILVSALENMSVIISREVFDALPNDSKSTNSNGNSTFQRLFLTVDDTDAAAAQIQNLIGDSGGNIYIRNLADMARSEQNSVLVLEIFIYGFIILISLICVANIFNTVTTNIALRRREFAMLRSVGMTPDSFNKMIRFESIFYGLKALLYGLPISFAISLQLHQMQSDVFEVGFSLPWVSYGVAVVLIFVIVGATMLYSGAKIKKENIIDALKAENL